MLTFVVAPAAWFPTVCGSVADDASYIINSILAVIYLTS